MRKCAGHGVRLMIALAAWWVPQQAWAWEQSMTCYDVFEDCQEGLEPYPTAWETPCISIYLNEDGTDRMPFESVSDIVAKSVSAWNVPEVSSLRMFYAGLTNETRVGYNPYTTRNANIIVFRDDAWDEDPTIMALTSVVFRNSSGKIYDADIEINTFQYAFGIVTPRSKGGLIDLQNTLTHELGHVIGLDHSDVEDATMFPYSTNGVTYMQTLDDDDRAAIAAVYPGGGEEICSFREGYFEKPDCAMNRPCGSDGVCSAHVRQVSKKPFFALALVVLAFIFFAVMRRYVAGRP